MFARSYECNSCGRSGFESADMPSHSSVCRSKVAILIVVPRKYVVLIDGKEFKQFQLEFEFLNTIFFMD